MTTWHNETNTSSSSSSVLTPDNAAAHPVFAGLTLQPPSESTKLGICMILYGPAGAGKTPVAASCADSLYGAPVLFLDAEGGTSSISHYSEDKLRIAQIYKWEDIERFQRQVFADPKSYPYQTTVFDNLSEYYVLATRKICGDREMPSQPEYGKINALIIALVEDWRDFTRRTGRNVIFIAWDDRDKDENNVVKNNIAFTPGVQKALPGKVDIIGHLTVHNNPPIYTRILSFAPNPKSVAKFRRSLTSNAQKIPYEIPFDINSLPMPDILATLKDNTEWPTAKYRIPDRQR